MAGPTEPEEATTGINQEFSILKTDIMEDIYPLEKQHVLHNPVALQLGKRITHTQHVGKMRLKPKLTG